MRLDDVLKRKADAPMVVADEGSADEPTSQVTATPSNPDPAPRVVSPSVVAAVGNATAATGSLPSATGRFGSLGWHSTFPPLSPRNPWAEMPSLNRFFCAMGGLCLLLAAGKTFGPPIAES